MTPGLNLRSDRSTPILLDNRPPEILAFTLVELLAVIGTVAPVAALFFPVLPQARAKGRQATCVSNLHQLGAAVLLYAQDSDDRFPLGGDPLDVVTDEWSTTQWASVATNLQPLPSVLLPYAKSQLIWACPSDIGFVVGGWTNTAPFDTRPSSFETFGSSYYYYTELAMRQLTVTNVRGVNQNSPFDPRGPSDIVMLYDGTGAWHGGPAVTDYNYNCVFADGHTKLLGRTAFVSAFEITLMK